MMEHLKYEGTSHSSSDLLKICEDGGQLVSTWFQTDWCHTVWDCCLKIKRWVVMSYIYFLTFTWVIFWVTNTFRVYYFTLTQRIFLWKKGTFTSLLWATLLSLLHLNAIQVKMLQFIPKAPSTFLWATSDVHSWMIHSFESILFKSLIKPAGKPVNRFENQFEWFVRFLAARAESSEAVLTQSGNREFKNIKSAVPGAMPLPRHN